MKRITTAVSLAAFLAVCLHAEVRRIDPRAYLEHIKYLASDELEGRGDGTPGLEKAADYIAGQFQAAGLSPAGDGGTFFQGFEMNTGLSIESGNQFNLKTGTRSVSLEIGRDYQLISTSTEQFAPGTTFPVVFAGYGISAPAQKYDDYAEVDPRGKAVLIFTHEPQENDARSAFEGQTNTLHALIMRKVEVARARGARMMLVVDDLNHRPQTDRYRRWLREPSAEDYGIPADHLSRDRVQMALGTTINLETASREIDRDFAPKSRELNQSSVDAIDRTVKVRRRVRNVIGILKGTDATLSSEFVIVGAHYDHLGKSARYSMAANSSGEIHHGADDNASGTAAVIEMAKAATASRQDFRRSLIFMTYAGEEHGLLGSAYYVNHPSVPLDQTVTVLNLDMVGRTGGRVLVDGLANAPSIEDNLKAAQTGLHIALKALPGGAGAGASDDATFLMRNIPAINFFSGFHSDYHRPSDTWEKIDGPGGAAVADLALALARELANRADRPQFVETVREDHGGHDSGSAGPVSGYGPYFGSVPDFANEGQGVKFSDVRGGSPAAKAGFRAGDVMVSFGGAPIKTLYDFTFALRDKKPGDKVEVTVMRDGKPITATVELTNRP